MTISIGFIHSDKKIHLISKELESKQLTNNTYDLEEFDNLSFNLLFLDETIDLASIEVNLEIEQKYYPIINVQKEHFSFEEFQNLNEESYTQIFDKYFSRYILANNIHTIEEIVPTNNYLIDLWKNERHQFFNELWYILKSNLGTMELSLIFNDVADTGESSEQRPKLIKSFIKGTKNPEIFEGTQKEEFLMKEYEAEFEAPINIEEFTPEKGELVCAALVNQSPIIIMAKLFSFNQLQKAILVAIFTGLQSVNSK